MRAPEKAATSRTRTEGNAIRLAILRTRLTVLTGTFSLLVIESSGLARPPTQAEVRSRSDCGNCEVGEVKKLDLSESGAEAYSAKVDGAVMTILGDGTAASEKSLRENEDALRRLHHGVIRPAFHNHVTSTKAAWVAGGSVDAEPQFPAVIWRRVHRSQLFDKADVVRDGATRASEQADTQDALTRGLAPIDAWMQTRGKSYRASPDSPAVFAALTADEIEDLGHRNSDVAWIDMVRLQDPAGVNDATDIWQTTTGVIRARELARAANIPICVVEDDVPDRTNSLRIGDIRDPSVNALYHSRVVAGIISSVLGIPGVTDATVSIGSFYHADGDHLFRPEGGPEAIVQWGANLNDAWSWCFGGKQTPVANFSMGFPNPKIYPDSYVVVPFDGSYTPQDQLMDWYATQWPYPLIATATGNIYDGDASTVRVANVGYNTISVGGSTDWGGAIYPGHPVEIDVWQTSSWMNPQTPHQDYELPHLIAPAFHLVSADFSLASYFDNGCLCTISNPVSGTSFAAPQVTGAAALLLDANPNLTNWPEALRGILIATATTPVQDEAPPPDHYPSGPDRKSGVGVLNTLAAVSTAKSPLFTKIPASEGHPATTSGYVVEAVDGYGSNLSGPIFLDSHVIAGSNGYVRVVLSWDADVNGCTTADQYCDSVAIPDLDLWVSDENGNRLCTAGSFDSTTEMCTIFTETGHTYNVDVVLQAAPAFNRTYASLVWVQSNIPGSQILNTPAVPGVAIPFLAVAISGMTMWSLTKRR